MGSLKEDALAYHKLDGKPGKISILPTKPLVTQRDLGLAYTPGVAEPVLEIERDPLLAYEYTSKGNLVAVISNGTAILGLGNRGALASKPVMEGKCVLFKKFADVDAFDIEVNSLDSDEIIRTVAAISPTFGGINLEDFRSPECFYIENTLKSMLDIPVFHDDQHGTAIVASAALLNALDNTNRSIKAVKVVFSGAGAAGLATANQLVRIGVPRENIFMCDIHGLVYNDRPQEMFPEKAVFAQGSKSATLADTIKGADVFIGLSAADVLTPEMLQTMQPNPIVFAMANPNPEIKYEVARAARPDALLATGRSDLPNQINNVLCFPFLFRGALDVRALAINDEMKVAASQALADLAKQPVPKAVLKAYNLTELSYGPEYILPKAYDHRIGIVQASAVAEAAMKSGAARISIDIEDYRKQLEHKFVSPE